LEFILSIWKVTATSKQMEHVPWDPLPLQVVDLLRLFDQMGLPRVMVKQERVLQV
jgi:hypothetical protein